jgi:hypothetical protein
MSENLDLVRSILAEWERGDFSEPERAHPEIEYVVADGPAAGRWTGRDGMPEGARAVFDAWDGFRADVEDLRELGADRVLVLLLYSGRGKTSGLDLTQMRTEGAGLFDMMPAFRRPSSRSIIAIVTAIVGGLSIHGPEAYIPAALIIWLTTALADTIGNRKIKEQRRRD